MPGALILLPLLLQAAEPAAAPAQTAASVASEDAAPPGPDTCLPASIVSGRRKPGYQPPLPDAASQNNPGALRAPPPEAFPTDQIALPDRWRIMSSLCPQTPDQAIYAVFSKLREVCHSLADPYHQNTLKGDKPIPANLRPSFLTGNDWFFETSLTSDSVFEPRTFPLPIVSQTSQRPGSLDVFGKDASYVASQTFLVGAALIKGSTTFKPPEIEYRLSLGFNINYAQVPERGVLNINPADPTHRTDWFVGVQEAFIDKHLRNVSDRYDFDSLRVGIQPFQADFRGFLFNDDQLGVRLFGNRDDNRIQYNLAAFWRLEKDTNSGLNNVTVRPRNDWVFVANLYRQDFLLPGLTSQFTVVYNRNREATSIHYDTNGFPVRPAVLGNARGRDYDVTYLGTSIDGHVHRINVTGTAYLALGEDRNSIFTGRPAAIRAWFAAGELSYDHDWMRFRLSGLIASGDSKPGDNTETGFDAISENPIFAGADTSYWIRQSIPFIAGGQGISLNGRNGILNDLRSSKDEGQANFNNPGTILLGAGADFDVAPQLRLSANANHLWFQNTATLQTLPNQANIGHDIGWDLSTAAIWRPKATQNIVLRLSGAVLVPGQGFQDLFANQSGDRNYYSLLANLLVSY